MSKLKKFFSDLIGGRPMRFTRHGFRDIVSGNMVSYYTDTKGREWMATSRWGWDRIRSDPSVTWNSTNRDAWHDARR